MSRADQEIRPTEASRVHCLVGWGVYALTAMVLLESLPRDAFDADTGRFILLIGVIAVTAGKPSTSFDPSTIATGAFPSGAAGPTTSARSPARLMSMSS